MKIQENSEKIRGPLQPFLGPKNFFGPTFLVQNLMTPPPLDVENVRIQEYSEKIWGPPVDP